MTIPPPLVDDDPHDDWSKYLDQLYEVIRKENRGTRKGDK